MKPEDKEFVREVFPWIQAEDDRFEKATYLKWSNRLLTLLIESEGMRMKAEFYQKHEELGDFGTCFLSNGDPCPNDVRHFWTETDWIAAARKEIEG